MTLTSYADGRAALWQGDCMVLLSALGDNTVDSIVTDPPYGLGFMGKKWDALPPGEEWARECLRVLKPGGHLLAFGGTRTWHRLAVAVEDAGFEVRDSIAWLYGSGFPKSLDVSKAIDKAAGVERWQGWGTALKPAFEPIVVARKPLSGTVAANVLTHGTGALNVDGCRVETTDDLNGGAYAEVGNRSESASLHAGSGMNVPGKTVGAEFVQPAGRWPANVVLDESQAAALDKQSGTLKGGANPEVRGGDTEQRTVYGGFTGGRNEQPRRGTDSGGASRFFYVAKAPKKERPVVDGVAHPTVKPLALMRWLVRLVTPPDGLMLDTFAGSGTTGEAALLEGFRVLLAEDEADYLPLIVERLGRAEEVKAS